MNVKWPGNEHGAERELVIPISHQNQSILTAKETR